MLTSSLKMLSLPLLCFFTSCTSVQKEVFQGDQHFDVKVKKYPAPQKAVRSLIIMPPTGGSTFLDQGFAKKFQKANYDVYIIESWPEKNEYNPELTLHNRLYERGQRAIKTVLDRIETPFVGMLGTSVGALHAVVAASQFPELDAVFVVVGGSPQMEIVVHSTQKSMQDLKKDRYKKYGFKNNDEYLSALNKEFKFEIEKLPPLFKDKKLGMISSKDDELVPAANQQKLKDFWNPATHIELSGPHFWAIFKSWNSEADKIFEFFDTAK